MAWSEDFGTTYNIDVTGQTLTLAEDSLFEIKNAQNGQIFVISEANGKCAIPLGVSGNLTVDGILTSGSLHTSIGKMNTLSPLVGSYIDVTQDVHLDSGKYLRGDLWKSTGNLSIMISGTHDIVFQKYGATTNTTLASISDAGLFTSDSATITNTLTASTVTAGVSNITTLTATNISGTLTANNSGKIYGDGTLVHINESNLKVGNAAVTSGVSALFIESETLNDSQINFSDGPSHRWAIGNDNSSTHSFVITTSTDLSTLPKLKIAMNGDTSIGGGLTLGANSPYNTNINLTSKESNVSLKDNVPNALKIGSAGREDLFTLHTADENENVEINSTRNISGASDNTNKVGSLKVSSTTILGAMSTDSYVGSIRFNPIVQASGSTYILDRYNYMHFEQPDEVGTAIVQDACTMMFDANAGTHRAVDAGSTHGSIITPEAWIKVNINGVLHYIPAYDSKT